MKKLLAIILSLAMILLLCACGDDGRTGTETVSEDKTLEKTTIADFSFKNMMGMNKLVEIHRYDLTAGTITIYPLEYGGRYDDLNIAAKYATDFRYMLWVVEDGYYYTDFVSYYGKPENNKKDASKYEIIDDTAISYGYSVITIETDYDVEKNYLVVKLQGSGSDEYYVPMDLINWHSGDFDRDTRSITYKFK